MEEFVVEEPKRGPGRPKGSRNTPRTRTLKKNITLDPDAVDALHEIAEKIQAELGFPMTLSQVLHRVIFLYRSREKS